MATDPNAQQDNSNGGYLGTTFPAPTDPNYYLNQVGLGSLLPQGFTQESLSGMFSPQGMQFTPANNQASNPFLQQYLDANGQATHLQRKEV